MEPKFCKWNGSQARLEVIDYFYLEINYLKLCAAIPEL
jgi:hypothetical protein